MKLCNEIFPLILIDVRVDISVLILFDVFRKYYIAVRKYYIFILLERKFLSVRLLIIYWPFLRLFHWLEIRIFIDR